MVLLSLIPMAIILRQFVIPTSSTHSQEPPMKKILLLSLLAGVVMFVWGFTSWAVLPWHMSTANKFTDEIAVSQVLKANAPEKGVYFLPYAEEDHGPEQVGAFANVLPGGTAMNMGVMMLTGLIVNILAAVIGLYLLSMTCGLSFWGKVGFFTLVGLAIGFVSHAPYWNWFSFSTPYVAVMILDTIITWFLAGLAVAKFAPTRT